MGTVAEQIENLIITTEYLFRSFFDPSYNYKQEAIDRRNYAMGQGAGGAFVCGLIGAGLDLGSDIYEQKGAQLVTQAQRATTNRIASQALLLSGNALQSFARIPGPTKICGGALFGAISGMLIGTSGVEAANAKEKTINNLTAQDLANGLLMYVDTPGITGYAYASAGGVASYYSPFVTANLRLGLHYAGSALSGVAGPSFGRGLIALGARFGLWGLAVGLAAYGYYKFGNAYGEYAEGVESLNVTTDDFLKNSGKLIDEMLSDGIITSAEAYALGDITKFNRDLADELAADGKSLEIPVIQQIGDVEAAIYGSIIRSIKNLFRNANKTISPLALDLDGNGVTTTSIYNGINFDHNANGFAEQTGWVSTSDGILVRDINSNGTIDSGRELFGENTLLSNGDLASGGFEALADLDSNLDGVINSNDTAFSDLKIWVDANSNGITDSGELYTLSELNIKSINLDYETVNQEDSEGNLKAQVASFTKTDDTTYEIADIKFQVDEVFTQATEILEVSSTIEALPDAKGYGNVYDLHQAMVRDTDGSLQDLVEDFISETSDSLRHDLVDDILVEWTENESIDANAEREWFNERFNGILRDELLNGEIFYTLKEAQIMVEQWKNHYNTVRPHSSLGYKPPAPETMIPNVAKLLNSANQATISEKSARYGLIHSDISTINI